MLTSCDLQVDFEQEDGTTIKNVISQDSSGALHMTYVFEINSPNVKEGSEEAGKELERLKGVSLAFIDWLCCANIDQVLTASR